MTFDTVTGLLTAISTDFERFMLLFPLMIFLSVARGYFRFIFPAKVCCAESAALPFQLEPTNKSQHNDLLGKRVAFCCRVRDTTWTDGGVSVTVHS